MSDLCLFEVNSLKGWGFMSVVEVDPLTRIEGHLGVRTEIENGKVKSAWMAGEMFRGFEKILQGRDPFDAQQIVQRICGVCPVSHGTAATLAQEAAYKITPPKNARIMRNLILAANYIQSHILHFYHLCALDFVDIAAITKYSGNDRGLNELKGWVLSQLQNTGAPNPAAPFLPRYSGNYIENTDLNCAAIRHYLDALDMRTLAHKMAAIFAGKMPHFATIVPGGITESPTADKISAYRELLNKLETFILDCYLPDVVAVAKAYPQYCSMGAPANVLIACGSFPQTDDSTSLFFPRGVVENNALKSLDVSKITEDVLFSRFKSASNLAPDKGETEPDVHKTNAYSWLKAPRYEGKPAEVGPLARVLVAYHANNPVIKPAVDKFLADAGLTLAAVPSVMGRHAARAIEAVLLCQRSQSLARRTQPQPTLLPLLHPPKRRQRLRLRRSPPRRPRALDRSLQQQNRPLPVRRPHHLERLPPRRPQRPRPHRTIPRRNPRRR